MKKLFLKQNKRIFRSIITVLIISILFMGNCYASFIENDAWKIIIKLNNKTLSETRLINFNVLESSDVVRGKIAPGGKARANVEIDLSGTKVPVDINIDIGDYSLKDVFELRVKIDDESYELGSIKTIELEHSKEFTNIDGKKNIVLEIEWKNSPNDNAIGNNVESITIPIKVTVKEHV